jgi:hypothetical protein
MPAWSVPGSHSVGRPDMRFHRVMVSSTAAVSACPMCSDPVTLGGGSICTKQGRDDSGTDDMSGL